MMLVASAPRESLLSHASERGVGGKGCGASDVIRYQTLLVLDVVLEFVPVVLDERAHRHRRCVSQRADRTPLNVVRDIVEQIQILGLAAAVLDAIHHTVEPTGAFAAGRALAARFLVVE